jgi:hypothetical protein
MTTRIAAIEVSHWHAVFDSALGPSAKPLALTQFSPRRELIPII